MKAFRIVLSGLLAAVVAVTSVVALTLLGGYWRWSHSKETDFVGGTIVSAPLVVLVVFPLAGFIVGCWWQWRREQRRVGL